MSTIAEIEEALPKLSDEQLVQLARTLRRVYRERHNLPLYDDSHGVYAEQDMIAAAEEAFLAYDREEEEHAKRESR